MVAAGADIRILPATEERWSDVCELLDVSGEAGCWCQP